MPSSVEENTKEIYCVRYTHSGRNDIRKMKQYILEKFQYRELGIRFTAKMKKATKEIAYMPEKYSKTGFLYKGYEIYIKYSQSYMFFFVINKKQRIVTILRVMQDGMNWNRVLSCWLRQYQ